MGKYMKKGKNKGEIKMIEIPQTNTIGVKTRAKSVSIEQNSELSYLQLRNRRLHKPNFQTTPKHTVLNNSRVKVCVGSASNGSDSKRKGYFRNFDKVDDLPVVVVEEASCGENNLDFDSREERSTRESTPCSLIRGSETIGTPGSTTRSTCSGSANRQARNSQRAIPTTPEMDEFFAGFELHQQKQFIDKYNYDIMNDMPLPGRYEWVRVDN